MSGELRLLDAVALGATGVALAAALLVLVLVPQRLAQRSAADGVLTLRLGRQGELRLWNQPIRPLELRALLRRAAARNATTSAHAAPPLRLLPDPGVPWGSVQSLVAQLEDIGLPIELQLP